MRHYDLPPLSQLEAFEAAARTLSFTKAADELSLTQSAISRQIKALEEHLDLALFRRLHRALRLTRKGRRCTRRSATSSRSFTTSRPDFGAVPRTARSSSPPRRVSPACG